MIGGPRRRDPSGTAPHQMRLSRRDVLGAGGAALATGLAGCVATGPFRRTSISASVRKPFGTEPPVSVPVAVDVFVQNVDSKDVALREVTLLALDADREPLATQRLGDFSWHDAAPERRGSEEYDEDTWGDPTAYYAEWSLETALSVEAVPAWLTFRVEAVQFDDEEAAAALFVGTARATSPPPEFAATVGRLDLDPPLPERVGPEHFSSHAVEHGVGGDRPLLPTPTPDPSTPTPDPSTPRSSTPTSKSSTPTSKSSTSPPEQVTDVPETDRGPTESE